MLFRSAKGGRVETATVWSDCLMAHLPGQVADSLQDVPFHAEALAERVFQLAAAWDTAQAEEQGALRDIAEWLRVHPL